jgi:hypothetical protein
MLDQWRPAACSQVADYGLDVTQNAAPLPESHDREYRVQEVNCLPLMRGVGIP